MYCHSQQNPVPLRCFILGQTKLPLHDMSNAYHCAAVFGHSFRVAFAVMVSVAMIVVVVIIPPLTGGTVV